MIPRRRYAALADRRRTAASGWPTAGRLTPFPFQPRPFAAAVGGFDGKRPKRVLIKMLGA